MMPVLGSLDHMHRDAVRELLSETAAFNDAEIDVALELFDESITDARPDHADRGSHASGPEGGEYEFIGAFSRDRELLGYVCFGPTPATDGTYDLYWLAVHPRFQRSGAGSRLVADVAERLAARRARILLAETSSRADYESARRFYERQGFAEEARIPDFYAPGDDRVIYGRRITRTEHAPVAEPTGNE
jgi:ribosomal protein S18 acetylase RimI-like enzyme